MTFNKNSAPFDIWGVTFIKDDARLARLSEAERRQLRGERLGAIFKLMPVTVVANLTNMITLTLAYKSQANYNFLIAWDFCMCALLLRWVGVWRNFNSTKRPPGASIRALKMMTLNSAIMGLGWAFPVAYLFKDSNADMRAILIGIMVGMVAGGALMLGTVWQAAVAFALAATIPAGIAVALSGFTEVPAAVTFGLSFFMVVAFVVVERSELFVTSRLANFNQRRLTNIRNEQLRDLQESSNDILWEINALGNLVQTNERLAELFQSPWGALEGTALIDIFGDTAKHHVQISDNSSIQYIRACLRNRKPLARRTVQVTIEDELRCWAISGKPILSENGTYIGFRGLICDVTETLRAQAASELLAKTDPMTGLPNRLFLQNYVETAFKQISGQTSGFALVTLDLDRFKQVNDSYGHHIGDELLRQCSSRLIGALRANEAVTRFGGDEFVLVLRTTDMTALQEIAGRLIRIISSPYAIDGHLLNVGASIGIALAPHDAITYKELLRNSDQALYRAKAEGRGRFCLFSNELGSTVSLRRQTEADLRDAIGSTQISLHFQPILEMNSGRIVSCETLVRWEHPERGSISPVEFIAIAEDTGLIVDLGTWILETACREAVTWPHEVRVAVNVSAVQFRCQNFAEQVRRALRSSGLPANRLDIEITESVLITDRADTLRTFNELREIGVQISLDDFGTGYSSLAYLSEFPIDKLKIDQSFVRKLGHQTVSSAIIRAITDLGKALGIATIAEGVETMKQMELLRDQGCTHAQGYLISRPVRADQISFLLGLPQMNTGTAPPSTIDFIESLDATEQAA